MAVVERSSSAAMVVPVTLHIYAAAFPIACVDSAPPVPCRAGICVLVNDDAGPRERRAFSRQESVTLLQQAHGVRLAHRSRRQKARRPARKFCRTACWRFSRQPRNVWFHGHSTVAIIETAFHYVNCHPRGDPVSSLSNDILCVSIVWGAGYISALMYAV